MQFACGTDGTVSGEVEEERKVLVSTPFRSFVGSRTTQLGEE